MIDKNKHEELLKKVSILYNEYQEIIDHINCGDPCENGLEYRAFEQGIMGAYKLILPMADNSIVDFIANEIKHNEDIIKDYWIENSRTEV